MLYLQNMKTIIILCFSGWLSLCKDNSDVIIIQGMVIVCKYYGGIRIEFTPVQLESYGFLQILEGNY